MIKLKEDITGWIMSEHGVPNSRLTIIKQIEDHIQPNGKHRPMCLCKCSCNSGKDVIAVVYDVKNGHTLSCGCLQKESLKEVHKQNRKKNEFDLSKEYGIGWTNNTNEEFYFDLEDYDKIKNYCWYAIHRKNTVYKDLHAYDSELNCPISMHQLLGYKNYDHINRNTFDNRKSNLRPANYSENSQNRKVATNNTSGITGVYWNKSALKWSAQIQSKQNKLFLGLFDKKEDAIKARLNAEENYYGEFAPQRHLFEEYGICVEGDECI